MRKLMLVLGLVMMLVPLFTAATALAAQGRLIQCKTVPCYGGSGNDKLLERIGNGKRDRIVPRGGDDLVSARKYTNDIDRVRGGGGSDKINVADGDTLDTANGGKGRDFCIVDSKREVGPSCFDFEVRR
jgi:hypothetical protein